MRMPSLRDLIERRVPHYLAIYLATGWGLIEFTSFLEERYALAPAWTDLVLFTWALLVPSVLLFTYNHGRPGRDEWARSEKVGIPLNVIIAIAVLGIAFSGRDLGATTTKVTVTDETGAVIERTIAKSQYRKRLALFTFDVAPGDTAAAWLAEGVPLALGIDLTQDIFLDVRPQSLFRSRIQEAGIQPGQSVPLGLKRRIAQEMHLPLFVSGVVSTGVEGVTIRVTTYETATGAAIRERVTTNRNVLTGVDAISVMIRQDLGLPAAQPAGVRDLPVAELLSDNPEAFRAFVDGQIAFGREDWDGAERRFLRATELDAGFAFAHYAAYQTRVFRGDAQGAIPALNAAIQHSYRLSERAQFLVKIESFFMKQEMDKAYAVARMMVELYPDDPAGHQLSAQLEEYHGDRPGAIESLRRIVELDPQRHELMLQIGSLQDEIGAFEDALATYRAYAQSFPEDVTVQRRIAGVTQVLGRFDDARAALERALIIEPSSVHALTALAGLERATGNLDAAWQLLQSAIAEASTPNERSNAYGAVSGYHQSRGRMRLAVDAAEQSFAALAEYQPPAMVMQQRLAQVGMYARAGMLAQARAVLENAKSQFTAPFNDFWHIGQLALAIELRDSTEIHEAEAGVQRVFQAFRIAALRYALAEAEAVQHEIRGDWSAALRAHERRLELEPKAVATNRDIARALRQLGRPQDARDAIGRHLRASPYNVESGIEAARIAMQLGDSAAARDHVQRVAHVLDGADPGYRLTAELRDVRDQLAR